MNEMRLECSMTPEEIEEVRKTPFEELLAKRWLEVERRNLRRILEDIEALRATP